MSTELDRIAELARGQKGVQFTSIVHLLTVTALEHAWLGLRKAASAGVDGVTYAEYGERHREHLQELYDRLVRGQYRAQPLRRVYIPKEDGTRRPLSIPALEDKIVQRSQSLLCILRHGGSFGSGPVDRLVLADPILRPTREPLLLSPQSQQREGHPLAGSPGGICFSREVTMSRRKRDRK